ncbi:MAG: protease [Betaproteobacteria bacterium RIFCSPHIGHO2_12_FULL_69_13]|nr:MAG: protease [Betaproteobacteria bacterium RIFCSPHIGHO2_12_FULL_69_13]OGA67590.1 MAG: protease [Betaproteobacteria bacterium RIFCSPLOWO2_12_FULL_68_20]
MRALIVAASLFEDSELLVPYYRLKEEDIEVDIASIRKGTLAGKHGYRVEANLALAEVEPERYDLLVLPGGDAPAALRRDPAALAIAKSFFERGKPVAAICHGPQILVSAEVLQGRKATCHRSVAEELTRAGAIYEDSEVVVDGNLVTSREPADLPAFMRETMRLLRRPDGDAEQLAQAAV